MRKTHRWMLVLLAAALLPAQLIAQRGATRSGWLGVGYNVMIERRNDLTNIKITVNDVVPNSPADRAGIRRGDQIVRIDGREISAERFEGLGNSVEVGDTIRLTIASGDRERDYALVAAPRPLQYTVTTPGQRFGRTIFMMPDSAHRFARIFMDSMKISLDSMFTDSLFLRRLPGFRFDMRMDTLVSGGFFRVFGDSARTFNLQLRRTGDVFDFPHFEMLGMRSVAGAEFEPITPGLAKLTKVSEGLIVLRVGPDTPAARAGLEAGDVLTRVDGRSVNEVADLRSALSGGSGALRLEVVRDGKARTLELDRGRIRR
ncbi:MAG: PDZ domain-containing protein [Gemmatimonadota bacterium]